MAGSPHFRGCAGLGEDRTNGRADGKESFDAGWEHHQAPAPGDERASAPRGISEDPCNKAQMRHATNV